MESGLNSFLYVSKQIKKSLLSFVIVFLTLATSIDAQDKSGFSSYWKNGYYVESADGDFKMKFGGRIQYHFSMFSQDDDINNLFGTLDNGSEFRRLRFYNSGTIYNSVQYKLQLSYVNGSATLADVWIGLKSLPVIGSLRVGHLKEAFSLEMMTSSNNITFLERSLASAFKKQRNIGISVFNNLLENRVAWSIGLFQNTDKFGNSIGEGRNITARLVYLPYVDEDKRQFLHLGIAYSDRQPADGEYSVKSRPEAHLAPAYVGTGTINNASSSYMAGGEIALKADRFALQSEYIASGVDSDSGDFSFSGYYAEASFFLTNDHKKYSSSSSAFKGVTPAKNFNPESNSPGFGAWQVALRYSNIDLADKSISGGVLNDFTAGLNWFLNPATRISLNYTLSKLEDVGSSNIFQTKFQVAF